MILTDTLSRYFAVFVVRIFRVPIPPPQPDLRAANFLRQPTHRLHLYPTPL